jgi:hypothetical protein
MRRGSATPPSDLVPSGVGLPAEILRHHRDFSWVVFEQRLLMLVLGALFAGCAMVWALALSLQLRDPVVVRAPLSLKERAAAFYGDPDVSFDQMAVFLVGCVPLLFAIDDGGHSLLPLAQGLVAPEIYDEAERRLNAARPDVLAHAMTEGLTITGFSDVVSDRSTGRTAARLEGYLTVTVGRAEAQFFPWRARVLLESGQASRLSRYPFFLSRLEHRTGPQALTWNDFPQAGGVKG